MVQSKNMTCPTKYKPYKKKYSPIKKCIAFHEMCYYYAKVVKHKTSMHIWYHPHTDP